MLLQLAPEPVPHMKLDIPARNAMVLPSTVVMGFSLMETLVNKVLLAKIPEGTVFSEFMEMSRVLRFERATNAPP